ncbi:DUF1360 domain-containing protein [Embleya sp. AB8]|uniref:DUF1360 domain-containing protein n=1 Tax=Embleya sp. AB8 TaxID=3156304 RepID=UPI003C745A54
MISLAALVVLAAATYRATALAVHDSILNPVRDRIFDWRNRRPGSKVRDLVVDLISCVYCMGWWIAGAFLGVWLVATDTWGGTPLVVHGIEWFAVAGGGVLLNRWDDSRDSS